MPLTSRNRTWKIRRVSSCVLGPASILLVFSDRILGDEKYTVYRAYLLGFPIGVLVGIGVPQTCLSPGTPGSSQSEKASRRIIPPSCFGTFPTSTRGRCWLISCSVLKAAKRKETLGEVDENVDLSFFFKAPTKTGGFSKKHMNPMWRWRIHTLAFFGHLVKL